MPPEVTLVPTIQRSPRPRSWLALSALSSPSVIDRTPGSVTNRAVSGRLGSTRRPTLQVSSPEAATARPPLLRPYSTKVAPAAAVASWATSTISCNAGSPLSPWLTSSAISVNRPSRRVRSTGMTACACTMPRSLLPSVPVGVLGLDQQPHLPPRLQRGVQQALQGEDARRASPHRAIQDQIVGRLGQPRMPRAEVQLVELRQGVRADPATTVAGAFQPAVVQADQMAVAGQPHVAFEPVGTLGDRLQVGTERVLGLHRRGPAMGEDQRG